MGERNKRREKEIEKIRMTDRMNEKRTTLKKDMENANGWVKE